MLEIKYKCLVDSFWNCLAFFFISIPDTKEVLYFSTHFIRLSSNPYRLVKGTDAFPSMVHATFRRSLSPNMYPIFIIEQENNLVIRPLNHLLWESGNIQLSNSDIKLLIKKLKSRGHVERYIEYLQSFLTY